MMYFKPRSAAGRATVNAGGVGERSMRAAAAGPIALAVGALVLLAAGWGHRVMLAAVDRSLGQVVAPKQPLASLPLRLGDWLGRDEPLDPRVEAVKQFDDDYVNRVYVNRRTGRMAAMFVGYVGRPRSQMGHRPDVCYAAHGWDQVSQEPVLVPAAAPRPVPGILHEFRRPDGLGESMLVLATYMINGHYVQEPGELKKWGGRTPGWLGERPAYLVRIQLSVISSGRVQDDRAALDELMALVAGPAAELMPYLEG